ncbi:ABC transporter substrate-binding protein [Paenibacillus sp. TRM 82003]|uniref:ABC transporter substrate-binding protein n=1 Tax=Kineococcus sp. TRM81007 TaxID=2925831 RepID=UPI001F5908EA|nr:ABC transporter substrate-binding protein [Kineococcus sp. TRM81007]MCI2238532.1 ABC transporter substrate-binding protein [Kineococcus sp. TRM81007]MCI3921955.1 ABC transporter substrate-binding protein [Paenibacillus sp. TRM 82003]
MPAPRTTGPARRAPAALAAACALLTAACGAGPAGGAASGADGAGERLEVVNCGQPVQLETPPERVVLLKSAAVPYLHDLGVLERVVARAGLYPQEYYDAATLRELDAVPLLTERTDTSGHLRVSREVVLSRRPDLVLGEVDGLDRASLAASGIPLLEEPALCPTGGGEPGFESVYDQVELYGRVFEREERAREVAGGLRERVEAVRARTDAALAAGAPERTAAVLYPTVGGGVTYAYGAASTATPQLEAAGLRNVFADVGERVFEVTPEELLARDPQVLVLLHSDGDPAAVRSAVTELPGAQALSAVRDGEVLVQLFNFTEPATPLAVEGLERIADALGPAEPAAAP